MFKRKVYRHIVKCSLSPQGPKLIVYTIPGQCRRYLSCPTLPGIETISTAWALHANRSEIDLEESEYLLRKSNRIIEHTGHIIFTLFDLEVLLQVGTGPPCEGCTHGCTTIDGDLVRFPVFQ